MNWYSWSTYPRRFFTIWVLACFRYWSSNSSVFFVFKLASLPRRWNYEVIFFFLQECLKAHVARILGGKYPGYTMISKEKRKRKKRSLETTAKVLALVKVTQSLRNLYAQEDKPVTVWITYLIVKLSFPPSNHFKTTFFLLLSLNRRLHKCRSQIYIAYITFSFFTGEDIVSAENLKSIYS